ncbi:hypothetical protein [Knoellia aerolata]|uniref:ARB-07466-like C-terminal domain-containing protein n=1 Tax=Knoellia aerolata DSM 18566 TaxID=1385519 RepID=A0A0A0K183_9MICO|nr:hypothetical protein [Knoellia aerolata]KGN42072.1 hypothetical protein N801_03290 [Knoellia aerolata DSM 18566]
MFSPVSRAGRRRAQTSRRLPDLTTLSSVSRPTVVKALVGLGLASSVAAAIAIPVQASTDQVELSSRTSALVARDRAEAVSGTTSRSAARSAVPTARTALSAPAAAESAAVSAGTAGVTAVAKPKPAPKPKPTPKPVAAPVKKAAKKAAATSAPTRSTSSARTSTSSSGSSGSGSSMAYYDAGRAKGLGDNAAKVYSAIRSNFGITNIGGYRAGGGDHGSGRAVDVMVTGSRGDAVAQWAINNMGAYNITYVIWKQRIWLAGASGWRAMDDRGSVTANHYDHVHISVE